MKKVRVKDFKIVPYRTGSRLAGRENEVKYSVWTADGRVEVERGFSRKTDAQKWLSTNVKIANEMVKKGMWR